MVGRELACSIKEPHNRWNSLYLIVMMSLLCLWHCAMVFQNVTVGRNSLDHVESFWSISYNCRWSYALCKALVYITPEVYEEICMSLQWQVTKQSICFQSKEKQQASKWYQLILINLMTWKKQKPITVKYTYKHQNTANNMTLTIYNNH